MCLSWARVESGAGVAPQRFWKRGAADAVVTPGGLAMMFLKSTLQSASFHGATAKIRARLGLGLMYLGRLKTWGKQREQGDSSSTVHGPLAAVAEGLRLSLLVRP